MIRCPYCQSTTVGRVGTGQYYCWSCYYEFAVRKQGIQCYRIVEDGSLAEAETITLQDRRTSRMDMRGRTMRRMMKKAGRKAERLWEKMMGR